MNTKSLIPSAFFTPISLQFPGGWVGHLPFAAWVIRDRVPKVFAELGTHSGNSYFSFCQSVLEGGIATKCYAVDTWQGDAHAGQYDEEIFTRVDAHNQKHYAGFSTLMRMLFDDAVACFADQSVDLLHVDGLHTYEAVRHDFETWLPKLAPGALVLFHDTQVRESDFGVWQLWNELQEQYPSSLEFTHSNGLGVLQLNNAPDEKKCAWLQLSTDEKQIFKQYFAALGGRLMERYEHEELKKILAQREQILLERERQINENNRRIADREKQLAVYLRRIGEYQWEIDSIYQSTSWMITRPLRSIGDRLKRGREPFSAQTGQVPVSGLQHDLYRIGKKFYHVIPPRYRNRILRWSYHNVPLIFRGMPHYENWKNNIESSPFGSNCFGRLTELNLVPPAKEARGRVAVHLHIFYPDLISEFAERLKNMPFPYDLFVSVSGREAAEIAGQQFDGLPHCGAVNIKIVGNRGRDIAPLFCTFGAVLAGYDYIAHLHGKKSLYNKGATDGWREYLCNALLGSKDRVRRIFTLMQGENPRGIVYPQNFIDLPYMANTWLANRRLAEIWCPRLGITRIPRGYFDVASGSMFWARGDALAPLFQAGITQDDFPEESGQTDGTLAHCIERLFVLSSLKQGMPPGILQDEENPGWSAWRLDRYMSRSYESVLRQIRYADSKLIGFDIFDTLLSRPLLDPESIKKIVARRAAGDAGRLYLEYRAAAERDARASKGRDVSLEEIYARLGEWTGLDAENLSKIRREEELAEKESLVPRKEVVQLYLDTLAAGKKVALITDMFLPRSVIEKILHEQGIEGWNGLFLSNEIGVRKDSDGALYKHVLDHYGIEPGQLMMIGDNERSDMQIPADMGASFIHVMRPVEVARSLPRFSELITDHEGRGNIDEELTLGLVVRRNFDPVGFPGYDPASLVPVTPYHLGYSLVGPLLVSFAQWLLQNAKNDGVERLYFLSREGKLIREVFDKWVDGDADVPVSEYLVVSRRAAGVSAIEKFEDILEIARMIYFQNTLEHFLFTRFGLRLDDDRWKAVRSSLGWERESEVRVDDRQIKHLIPLFQMLQPEIIAQGRRERAGLLQYLRDKGLTSGKKCAVVDIGYGGSVQGYLNALLKRKIEGYYMMTDERAPSRSETYGVLIRGCFLENVRQSSNAPLMYRYSFEVEKMLSSNEPQIEFYQTADSGHVRGCYADIHPEEVTCCAVRQSLQEGAMDFTAEALQVRRKLLPDFQPSCRTAQALMDAFLGDMSPREKEFMSSILLDDHYCGRGLVKT
ncbi:MAG TPA: rhamnan synthesis F family protein [Smithellaceae bacterium]|nr:rhamnan synthesis F family protein [Smithellaceae bacterium]HPL65348.1 rhamnan synthesis F family protein [Smithellaceae bacterium]